MFKNTSLLKTFAIVSLVALSTFSFNGIAQNNPGGIGATVPLTVNVTPESASDSLATPIYGVNVTACLEVFNWENFAADTRNGITNSNPYDSKGCVSQTNVTVNGTRSVVKNNIGQITDVNYTVGPTQIVKTKYKDFDGTSGPNSQVAKDAFGEMPLVGVFPNSGFNGQAIDTYTITGQLVTNGGNFNRGELAGLNTIYTDAELNLLYNPQTARTGAPRLISTGPDNYTGENYNGGTCRAEGGVMRVRTSVLDGTPDQTPLSEDQTGSVSTPITSCKLQFADGTDSETVIDQSMLVYQYVYVINYPTVQQCQQLFNIVPQNYQSVCLKFYKDRLGKVYAGNNDGSKVVYTYTFYSMFSDANTVPTRFGPDGGWKNPDINGPRKTYTSNATAAQLNAYYPRSNLTEAQKRGAFEGYIRQADGYSIYVM